MDDMTAFIAARLEEDERIARAVTPDDWGDGDEWARHEWEDLPDAAFTHAKRHDPSRVLREVAAKRAILAEIAPWMDSAENDHWYERGVGPQPPYEGSVMLRKMLAAVWSDHPDYRPEWGPCAPDVPSGEAK